MNLLKSNMLLITHYMPRYNIEYIPGEPAILNEMHGANNRVLCCPVSLHNRCINKRRPSSDLCSDSLPIHCKVSKYQDYCCA